MLTDLVLPMWVEALLVVILTISAVVVIQFFGFRALRFAEKLTYVRKARRQQFVTLIHVLQWGLTVVVGIVFVLTLLSTFGLDITPLIAGASIAGLAVSMAAQSLVKDMIGGVLILVENQYVIGDMITVGVVTGTVERITLRFTQVRDGEGKLVTIPNGDVRIVGNMSRG